jgi:hypothetical protein
VAVVIGSTTFEIMTGGRILAKYVDGAWIILDYSDGRAQRVISGSIISDSLASYCVTNRTIAPGAVDGTKLGIASVSQLKMADDSVGTDELIDLNVTESKLANQAVTAIKIADEAVDSYHLKDQSVTKSKLAMPIFLGPDSAGSSSGATINPIHRRLYRLSGQIPTTVPIAATSNEGLVIYVFSGSSTTNDPWSIAYMDVEGATITRSIPRGGTVAMMSQSVGWLCIGVG